jgi:hypothetical protein
MSDYDIFKLIDAQWTIDKLVKIYLMNWGDHFREEWNVTNEKEMRDVIYFNFMDKIYVMLNEEQELMATVLMMHTDFIYNDYFPWITCLYVNKNYKKIYGKILLEFLDEEELYMWCYKENNLLEIENYKNLGFEKYKELEYNCASIVIMKKLCFNLGR